VVSNCRESDSRVRRNPKVTAPAPSETDRETSPCRACRRTHRSPARRRENCVVVVSANNPIGKCDRRCLSKSTQIDHRADYCDIKPSRRVEWIINRNADVCSCLLFEPMRLANDVGSLQRCSTIVCRCFSTNLCIIVNTNKQRAEQARPKKKQHQRTTTTTTAYLQFVVGNVADVQFEKSIAQGARQHLHANSVSCREGRR
jgi:hypothetical protein